MDLMDFKEGEKLKKHPKLLGAKIEIEKKGPLEMSEMEMKPSDDGLKIEDEEDEMSPEMIAKLLESLKE